MKFFYGTISVVRNSIDLIASCLINLTRCFQSCKPASQDSFRQGYDELVLFGYSILLRLILTAYADYVMRRNAVDFGVVLFNEPKVSNLTCLPPRRRRRMLIRF